MVNIGTGHTPTGGNNQEGAGVVLMLGAAAFAAWPIVILFSISALLSVVFGAYAIFALVLMFRAEDAEWERRGWIRFLLVISALTMLLITPFCIVGKTGWYTIMGVIVTASYLGALSLGLWAALKGFLKALAGVMAATLALVLVILPPPEAAGSEDEKAKWKVKLTAEDVDHQPIAGALTQCTTMMAWQNPRGFKIQARTMKETDDKGEAEFEFSAEMRFKIAVCGVTKPATENEEGYALRTGFAPNPFHGGTFPLTITLDEKPEPAPATIESARILARGAATAGLDRLNWSKAQRQSRDRIVYLRTAFMKAGEADKAERWPDLSERALSATVEDWLAPFIVGRTRLDDIGVDDLQAALDALVPYALKRELDQQTPSHFTAPTGSSHAIDYSSEEGPAVALRVQELFGLDRHPAIADGAIPLTLHLLSPAHRPIQITKDLPGFWRGSWASVRADLRGRYPRHPWPENPREAAPTTRAKPRGT
mgnify:CR=1 FL=1